jgi:hypothetical protein
MLTQRSSSTVIGEVVARQPRQRLIKSDSGEVGTIIRKMLSFLRRVVGIFHLSTFAAGYTIYLREGPSSIDAT